ncbi:MAG TPA: substrate-binding domain-containing protein, partial [Spirochaetia bacterium]|nr:substrate-binding domain-containing protein [Spirochaetia bacterium]
LLLNGPSKLSSSRQFERGYAKVLRSHGIAFDSRLVLNMHLTIDAGHKTIRDMLSIRHCRTTEKDPGVSRTLNDFTAIVALSDLLALGAYKAAIESGFKIPDDYSVVGYDNIFAAPFLSPPLTTVNQPKELTGKSSINLLFDLIEGKRTKPERLILRPELVIRQSVQSIRKLDSRSKTTSR